MPISMDTVAIVFAFLITVNVLLSGFVVFFERRNPASSWAWLLVLFLIPVFGFLLYLLLGRDGKREKVFAEKGRYDQKIYYDYVLNSQKYCDKISSQRMIVENGGDITGFNDLNGLAHLNLITGSWLTENNTVTLYTDGVHKFRDLLEDISLATEYIHLEYYIVRNDHLGREVVAALAKKAKEGVEVRFLYDGMGCSRLDSHFFDALTKAGGMAAAFLPPLFLRINYRNHRKLCVIDGKIGYIGGFNIGDEYLGIVKRYGNWRDTHTRITGDAVDQLQLQFILDWNFTAKQAQIPLEAKYFPPKEEKQAVKIQVISSGPDNEWRNIRNGYFKMINEAKHHIYISTPYFVPDDSIFESLKVAALAGKDVRIIIPGNPDHLFVYWASMSYLGELLEVGVKCYQYEKGFIHTKMISVDSIVSSIGSANMDIRSFAVNFEVNAFLFDRETATQIESDFIRDLEHCLPITKQWYYHRNWLFKVKESIARLISPLL